MPRQITIGRYHISDWRRRRSVKVFVRSVSRSPVFDDDGNVCGLAMKFSIDLDQDRNGFSHVHYERLEIELTQ